MYVRLAAQRHGPRTRVWLDCGEERDPHMQGAAGAEGPALMVRPKGPAALHATMVHVLETLRLRGPSPSAGPPCRRPCAAVTARAPFAPACRLRPKGKLAAAWRHDPQLSSARSRALDRRTQCHHPPPRGRGFEPGCTTFRAASPFAAPHVRRHPAPSLLSI
jgi:hypothetical protein